MDLRTPVLTAAFAWLISLLIGVMTSIGTTTALAGASAAAVTVLILGVIVSFALEKAKTKGKMVPWIWVVATAVLATVIAYVANMNALQTLIVVVIAGAGAVLLKAKN